jgi:hypothetical protein
MASPIRLIQVSCLLLASALGLLMAGCAGGLGAPSLSAPATPTPRTHPKAQPTTSLNVNLGPEYENLTPRDATVACSANDGTVVVRGSVQGALVTIRLSNLRKHQNLLVPPAVGRYSDRVTVTVASASPSQPLSYVVGFADGAYQGVGTIDVSKRGNSGTLNVSTPSPVGQEPVIQSSGIFSVTVGVDNMSLAGNWECP